MPQKIYDTIQHNKYMKKIILIILGIITIIGIVGAGWYYFNFQKYAPDTYVTDTPSGQITTNTTTGIISTSTPTYTLVDISTHKDATSCYSAINNSVYDLTMWINLHPGGKGAILSICGIDGTEKFMNQHRGKPKFMTILARYKIGTLKQ